MKKTKAKASALISAIMDFMKIYAPIFSISTSLLKKVKQIKTNSFLL